jgi:DNA-binding protein H-NS
MAATADLDRMSVKELRELLQRVDALIVDKQKSETLALREKMAALAAESGLSLEDIMGSSRGGKKGSVAAKYRNPADPSQTWTGRGRTPIWLNEKLAKRGVKKEDFAI